MRRTGDEEEEENEEEEREEGGGRAALRIQNEDPTHRRIGEKNALKSHQPFRA